jgi:type II secretory ATPase GspE/PulE/Tfp pilus assembly ATPase PilB-like protein
MSVSGNEIGDLLVDIGIITAEELASALEEQLRSGERLTAILDRLGLVTYHQLKDSLELQFGVNFISLAKSPPTREIADLVSEEVKRKYKLIPVANNGTQFTVAMVNPDDLIALDALRVQLRSGHLKKVVCTADEFEHCMHMLYSENAAQTEEVADSTSSFPQLNSQQGDTSAVAAVTSAPAAPPAPSTPAPAADAVKSARVPAKKHLQSLFGDDDDDDFDTPVAAAPMAPVTEPVSEPAVETITEPVAAPIPERAVEPVAESVAEPVAAPIPERAVEPVAESVAAPVAALTPEPAVAPAAEPVAQPVAALIPEPAVEPAAEPVAELVAAAIPEPVAEVSAQVELEAPPAAPEPVAPVSVTAPVAVARLDNHAETAHSTRVAYAEDVMETALANVTSHLIESSQTALTHDASRQLLEEVVESELGGIAEETDIHRMKEAQNASVMLLAHEIIGKATQKRCSDIHLEPDSSGVALRYFLHGELLADCMLPLEIHGSLVGSYKVIAGLDPQELNKPQDKKFTTRVEEDEVELRITTIPTDNGEMVAISMRFTDPNSAGAIAQAKMGPH